MIPHSGSPVIPHIGPSAQTRQPTISEKRIVRILEENHEDDTFAALNALMREIQPVDPLIRPDSFKSSQLMDGSQIFIDYSQAHRGEIKLSNIVNGKEISGAIIEPHMPIWSQLCACYKHAPLIAEWQQWAKAPADEGEDRKSVVCKMIGCLLTGSKHLVLNSMNLKSLPEHLPPDLTHLNITNNDLTSLPALPNTLTLLAVDDNKLTRLPALPHTLEFLNCKGNLLTELPELPGGLLSLDISDNRLSREPTVPAGLRYYKDSGNFFNATGSGNAAIEPKSAVADTPSFSQIQEQFNNWERQMRREVATAVSNPQTTSLWDFTNMANQIFMLIQVREYVDKVAAELHPGMSREACYLNYLGALRTCFSLPDTFAGGISCPFPDQITKENVDKAMNELNYSQEAKNHWLENWKPYQINSGKSFNATSSGNATIEPKSAVADTPSFSQIQQQFNNWERGIRREVATVVSNAKTTPLKDFMTMAHQIFMLIQVREYVDKVAAELHPGMSRDACYLNYLGAIRMRYTLPDTFAGGIACPFPDQITRDNVNKALNEINYNQETLNHWLDNWKSYQIYKRERS